MSQLNDNVPIPVIVGSPRSGTTLLRMMLDAHPEMAIPPETGFLTQCRNLEGADRETFFKTVVNYPPDASSWPDFKITKEEYWKRLNQINPFNVSDGFRLFYKMYAERFNKPRYGEKTPMYLTCMNEIENTLSEARFIHVIRDGRDVAVSLRKQWFSPGHDIEIQAKFWKENILEARRQGENCKYYLEIIFEELIDKPEEVLKKICQFIEIDFSDKMLEYYKNSKKRLEEHEGKVSKDGSVIVSKERRFKQQAATTEKPNKKRLNVWKRELTEDDIKKFEQVAGELLEVLGYKVDKL